jgi:hypothetical protein
MDEKFRRVTEAKDAISVVEPCAGRPAEFANFFHAVRALVFTEEPQCAVYREWFRDLFLRRSLRSTGVTIW